MSSGTYWGLRSESCRWLGCYLQRLGMDGCMLFAEDLFVLCSASFDGHSRGVSWLMSKSVKAASALVFTDPAGRLCVLDITIKYKSFRLIEVYAPNKYMKRPDCFSGSSSFCRHLVRQFQWVIGIQIVQRKDQVLTTQI